MGWHMTPGRFSLITAVLLALIGLSYFQPTFFGLASAEEVEGWRGFLTGLAVGVLVVWLCWWRSTPASRR